MLNKKAIAAFAAGATLLAGFAMSAPAFAEPSTTGSYADAASIHSAEKEVDEAHATVIKDREAVHTAQNDLAKEQRALAPLKRAAEKAKKDNEKAKKAFEAAKKALEDAEAKFCTDYQTKNPDKTLNDAKTEFKKQPEYTKLNKAVTDAETVYGKDETSGTQKALKEANEKVDAQQKVIDKKQDAVDDANDTLKGAEADLAAAEAYLRRLKGEPDPVKPGKPGKPGQPNKPGKPGKPGQPNKGGVHINTKGHKGKKQLSKTGVGVAFAALAAAMLAGMGAAVRKIRH